MSSRCAALLLTGGASRRFGSPKAELTIDGERLADRLARVLGAVCAPVLEVGPGYSALPSVRESPPGSGPLAAVAAGAAKLDADGSDGASFVVLAVDLPYVDEAFVRFLRDHPATTAVVPRVDGIAQPLCARFPVAAGTVARALVDEGARSMRALLGAIPVTWIDADDWAPVATVRTFADVDTPEDAARVGVETPR